MKFHENCAIFVRENCVGKEALCLCGNTVVGYFGRTLHGWLVGVFSLGFYKYGTLRLGDGRFLIIESLAVICDQWTTPHRNARICWLHLKNPEKIQNKISVLKFSLPDFV